MAVGSGVEGVVERAGGRSRSATVACEVGQFGGG